MTAFEADRTYDRLTERQPHMMTLLVGVMSHLARPTVETIKATGEWVAGFTLLGHYPPNANKEPVQNPYLAAGQAPADRRLPLDN